MASRWKSRLGTCLFTVLVLLLPAGPASAASAVSATGGWSVVTVPVTSGGTSTLNAVAAVSDSAAWAVGTTFTPFDPSGITARPLALRWNGTAWEAVPLPAATTRQVLLGVGAASVGDVWAVGRIPRGYGRSAPVALHYDGTAWTTTAPVTTSGLFYAVAAAGPGDAWAVGSVGRTAHPLVEHWNGTAWSVVAVPAADPALPGAGGVLTAISARAADDVWAVGRYSGGTGSGAYALHWNGTTWTSSRLAGPSGSSPGAVVAVGAGNVWAVANSATGGSTIQHWNGRSWSVTRTLSANDRPTMVGLAARSATDIWAVGNYLVNPGSANPTPATRTYHWGGTSWSTVDGPRNADLFGAAAAPGGQRVWAAGMATGPFLLTRTT
jgi:hypothetical protein